MNDRTLLLLGLVAIVLLSRRSGYQHFVIPVDEPATTEGQEKWLNQTP